MGSEMCIRDSHSSTDGCRYRRDRQFDREPASMAVVTVVYLAGVGRDALRDARARSQDFLKGAAENLLDLALIRHAWIGQATRIFQGVAGEHRDVVELGAELTQTGGNVHVLGQAANRHDGRLGTRFRGKTVNIGAHCKGDIGEAIGANQRVKALYVGQQDRVAHTMRQVVEPAQLVSHGVDKTQGCVIERHAGEELRVRHVFPRGHVTAVALSLIHI